MASSSQSFWEEALEIAESIDPPPPKKRRYEVSPDTPETVCRGTVDRAEPSSPLGFGGTELTFIPTHLRSRGTAEGYEGHSYLQSAEYAANSFGDIASYMKNKDKKVQTQNRELARATNLPQIFKGLTFYINGNTKPSMEELRRMLVQRGGTVVPFLRRKRELDFVIAPVLTIAKFKELENYRVIREGWVLECVEKEKVVDWRKWRLRAGDEAGLAAFISTKPRHPDSESTGPTTIAPAPLKVSDPVVAAPVKAQRGLLQPLVAPGPSALPRELRATEMAPLSAQHGLLPPPATPELRGSTPPGTSEHIKAASVRARPQSSQSLVSLAPPHSTSRGKPVPTPRQPLALPDSSSFSPIKSTPAELVAPAVMVVPPTAEQLSQRIVLSPAAHRASANGPPSAWAGMLPQPTDGEPAPHVDTSTDPYRSGEANKFAGRLMRSDDFRALHTAERGNEAGFIDSYYQNSRLHLLSTWKTELRLLVAEARNSVQQAPTVLPLDGSDRIIFHVDFDAFFVSVGLAKRPDLRGRPVVVCHSSGGGRASTSEIASASYEARKMGVKNGMSLGRARQLCGDDLATIPYEFETYRKHSTAFYRILLGYADELEAVSIDEALLEVTGTVTARELAPDEGDPVSSDAAVCVAEQIRSDIRAATGCEVSIGISHNILLARLATRKAKPGGVFHLTQEKSKELIAELDVASLPSVGYSMKNKLQDAFGTSNCGELLCQSRQRLRGVLGPKTGDTIYNFLRGLDDRRLTPDKERKSVSAEMNYGIRFKNQDQAVNYVLDLGAEVSKRLRAIGVKGRHLTLKIMHRHPEAPIEAPKFLGHGWCETYNRSVGIERRGQATDDATVIGEEAAKLLNAMSFDPCELRGVGIQITKLDHGPKQGEVERGQGRLSFAGPAAKGKEKMADAVYDFDVSETDPTSPKSFSYSDLGALCSRPESRSGSPAREQPELMPALPTQLDLEFLAALPNDIREEIQEEHAKRHGSRSGSRSVSRSPLPSPGPSRKATLNPAAHITKQLRPKHKTQLDAAMIAQGALYGTWSRAAAQAGTSTGPSLHVDSFRTGQSRSRSASLAPSEVGENDNMVGKYRSSELRTLGIDPSVFSALPEDVQAEVIQQERQKMRNQRLRTQSASPAKLRPPRSRSPQPIPTLSITVRAKPALFGARDTDDVATVLAKWVESRKDGGPNEKDTERVRKYFCRCLASFSGLDHVSQLLRNLKGVIRDVCVEDSTWWIAWEELFLSVNEQVQQSFGTGLRIE